MLRQHLTSSPHTKGAVVLHLNSLPDNDCDRLFHHARLLLLLQLLLLLPVTQHPQHCCCHWLKAQAACLVCRQTPIEAICSHCTAFADPTSNRNRRWALPKVGCAAGRLTMLVAVGSRSSIVTSIAVALWRGI